MMPMSMLKGKSRGARILLVVVSLLCLYWPNPVMGGARAVVMAEKDNRKEIRFHRAGANKVSVAGPWNDWCGSAAGAFDAKIGEMRSLGNGEFSYSIDGKVKPGRHEYKFVVDGSWEGGGNRTLLVSAAGDIIDPLGLVSAVTIEDFSHIVVLFSENVDSAGVHFALSPKFDVLRISWDKDSKKAELFVDGPLPLSEPLTVTVKGLHGGPIPRVALPDGVLQKHFGSSAPMGYFKEGMAWRFRLFAPRATSIRLALYSPSQMKEIAAASRLTKTPVFPPAQESHEMTKEAGGTWTHRVNKDLINWGAHYYVDGPGHDFDKNNPIVDPYAVASVFNRGPAVIREALPAGAGREFTIPKKEDLVICELHVRDYTAHESSLLDETKRRKFLGLTEGTPIRHLKRMGYNCVELLPVFEFDDEPPGTYHWGYMTSLFFAPDAIYGQTPLGQQVEDFKKLVDTFHKNGIAVLLDVVYNHTGAPHHFVGLDRAYYYRRDTFGNYSNVSGCGNDVRSESPMARRLIIESCRYWLERYGVDGFRFDLAHLIDLETLDEIAKMAQKVRPGAILIAEPWSFGGNNKNELGEHPDWTCWNDDFRNRVKEFVQGHLDERMKLVEVLSGSTSLWAHRPRDGVNYVESHDDHTLVDDLSHRKDHDGSHPTIREIRMNRMCTLMIMTAQGIPMLTQGQELLRSKGGCGNSYNQGDSVNAIRWDRLSPCSCNVEYVKNLIRLRKSEAGKPFRRSAALPGNSLRVVLPEEQKHHHPKAIGVIIPGKPEYLLLLNAHQRKAVPFQLPRGYWQQVADLETVQSDIFAGPKVKERIVLKPLDGRLLVRSRD